MWRHSASTHTYTSASTSTSTSCYSECKKCLITAVLLSSVTKRHMHTVTLDLASCSKQCTLLPQLPTELQAEVVDQVNYINMGAPYHDMSRACPVSHNIQKRKLFLERTARHAMGCQKFSLLQASVITAYKAHHLCFTCGGSRKSYDRQRVK